MENRNPKIIDHQDEKEKEYQKSRIDKWENSKPVP